MAHPLLFLGNSYEAASETWIIVQKQIYKSDVAS